MANIQRRLRSLCLTCGMLAALVWLPGCVSVDTTVRHFRVEVADFYYPAASSEESRALLPSMFDGITVSGNYPYSITTYRPRLYMGVIPFIDDNNHDYDRFVKASDVRVSAEEANGFMQVEFSLPASKRGEELESLNMKLPLAALRQLPSVKSRLWRSVPQTKYMTLNLLISKSAVEGNPDHKSWCVFWNDLIPVTDDDSNAYYEAIVSLKVSEKLPDGGTKIHMPRYCNYIGDTDAQGRFTAETIKKQSDSYEEWYLDAVKRGLLP